jgi:hypothetical protein
LEKTWILVFTIEQKNMTKVTIDERKKNDEWWISLIEKRLALIPMELYFVYGEWGFAHMGIRGKILCEVHEVRSNEIKI